MNTFQNCERESESASKEALEPLLDEYEYARIRNCSVATARRDRLLRKGCPYVKTQRRRAPGAGRGALMKYEDRSRNLPETSRFAGGGGAE